MVSKIFKREVIHQILPYLNEKQAIILFGARQVWKTSIMHYLMDKYLSKYQKYYIDLEDSRFIEILDGWIENFIQHLKEKWFDVNNQIFVFIDEIQYLSNPSSFIKLVVDHYENIKLIVSGSSAFAMKKKFQDSLVGRTIEFTIYNLSFKEFIEFKNYKIDLKNVKTQKSIDELITLYKEYVFFWWYPSIVLTDGKEKKERFLQQIIDTYIRKDVKDLGKIQDIDKFNRFVILLASMSWNLLNVDELCSTSRLARKTVEEYLNILEQTFIIHRVNPFHKNIRNELWKMSKIFFYDTWLMQMLWLKSIPWEILWSVFETSIFSQIVKKILIIPNYRRTQDKKEIDFIVNTKNSLLPIEVKLNFQKFNGNAIQYFCENYNIKDYKVIGLYWEKNKKSFIYPWEL